MMTTTTTITRTLEQYHWLHRLQVTVLEASNPMIADTSAAILLLLFLLLPLLTAGWLIIKCRRVAWKRLLLLLLLSVIVVVAGGRQGKGEEGCGGGEGTGKLKDVGDSAAVHPDIASADGSSRR